jgi:phosphoglycerate dehydrogenase-like enzyme
MLGMSVTGVRRKAEPVAGCHRTITYGDLDGLLPTTNWLILCCPASPVTRGLGNAARFAAMPRGSHVVNAARGSVVIEADLIAALRSGHIAGAYLDVFAHEPLDAASPLWDLPNVIVSPHTASHSLGQPEAVFDIFLDNLARFRAGQPLRNDIGRLE